MFQREIVMLPLKFVKSNVDVKIACALSEIIHIEYAVQKRK